MKTPFLFLVFILMLNASQVYAQPAAVPVKPTVPYWCSAPWPPPAGSDRTMGKDSNGQVCIKIAKEMPPTAPPVPSNLTAVIVPKEGATVTPAKDLLGQAAISVTLAQDEQGRPVLQAICPGSGFNEWDFKALQAGYHAKVVTRGKETFVIYEK